MERRKDPNYRGETSKGANRSNVRMRMYADDEEKKKKRSYGHYESGRSVHSRLEPKHKTKEWYQHRDTRSSGSEQEDDYYNHAMPSDLNIWGDVKEFMSEEDYSTPHLNSPYANQRHPRKSRKRGTCDSDPGSPESARGSRSWRPHRSPRKRPDLDTSSARGSGKWRRYASPLSRPDVDTTSRFKRFKTTVNKHRSPLCMDN